MNLSKKVLMITGGSRGIGSAVVKLAVQEGFAVAFSYKQNEEAATQMLNQYKNVFAFKGDVSNPDFAPLFFKEAKKMGDIVALVNNAGITGPLGAFTETTYETLRRTYEVNVLGTMLMTQEILKFWSKEQIKGSIVNVSSVAASLGAPHEYVHYAATKAAVETFTRGIGKEMAALGIRINCVSPGTVDTEIHAAAGDSKRPEKIVNRIPMKRIAQPEEIAKAILWLLSDEASYATATVLRINGGLE